MTPYHAICDAIDHTTNQRLVEAKKKNLGKHAEELAHREADQAKRELRKLSLSYESAIPTTPEAVRRPEHAFTLVRVRGTIDSFIDPRQLDIPKAQAQLIDMLGARSDEVETEVLKSLVSSLGIRGEADGTITTQEFIDRKLINEIQDKGSQFATWEFLLYVVPGSDSERMSAKDAETIVASVGTPRSYMFYLIDARPLTTALQVVAPTPGEQEAAMQMFGSDPNVLKTALNLVTTFLGVACLDTLPILREAIAFQILASATEGPRGHSLLIGPPGVGKSLVTKAAGLVQPVLKFVMPTKVTEAGLIGSGHSNPKNRKPGMIALAHLGAFSVEDFNQANSNKNQRLCATFTHVMAEGVVSDGSVSRTVYKAQTSIILDANRKSDVRRRQTDKTGFDLIVEDIGIPMNIFSRMTYVAEIPRDAHTQLQVAIKTIETAGAMPTTDKAVLDEKVKLFRVYAAMMRELHPVVEIPEQVRNHIAQIFVSINNTTEERFNRHPEFGDFMARQGKAMLMLTEAHARLQNRSVATVEDVAAIFPFCWRKMDWVKQTLFGGQIEAAVVDANTPARRHMVRLHLKTLPQATCTPKQVQRGLGLYSATLDTIHGDLEALLGPADEKGRFQVVTDA
jgi:hypothetical protein